MYTDSALIDSWTHLNGILAPMDTVNVSINRQFSHLPAYRIHQNASIWAGMVEEIIFDFKFDSFQSTPNTKKPQYFTAKSMYHALIQLDETIKETLDVFAQMDFNEEWFMIIALEDEHITMMSLVDHPDKIDTDTLDRFFINSSYTAQRDYNWMDEDN